MNDSVVICDNNDKVSVVLSLMSVMLFGLYQYPICLDSSAQYLTNKKLITNQSRTVEGPAGSFYETYLCVCERYHHPPHAEIQQFLIDAIKDGRRVFSVAALPEGEAAYALEALARNTYFTTLDAMGCKEVCLHVIRLNGITLFFVVVNFYFILYWILVFPF